MKAALLKHKEDLEKRETEEQALKETSESLDKVKMVAEAEEQVMLHIQSSLLRSSIHSQLQPES